MSNAGAALPNMSTEELACVYSAALLADDDISITQEKLATVLKAADIEVEPIWPMLYARALAGVNIKQLITNIGACPSGGAAPPGVTPGKADTEENTAEEAKPEEPSEEDSDEDMGINLFD